MKSKFLTILAATVLFGVLTSASSVKTAESVAESFFFCNATISNLQYSRSGNYVTFSWNSSGAAGYVYGGYSNCDGGPSGGGTFPTTTVYSNLNYNQVTLFSTDCGVVSHFGVRVFCSNGEFGGQDDLWYY